MLKILKFSLFCFLGIGVLTLGTVWGNDHVKRPDHRGNQIPGIYQGIIELSEQDEPIVVKIEADGTWTYITTPELERETTGLGSWERTARRGQNSFIKYANFVYIIDPFCEELFETTNQCLIYVGGDAKIDRNGHLEGTLGLSIQRADNTGEIIHLGVFTLDLQKQPLDKIRKIALTPTE